MNREALKAKGFVEVEPGVFRKPPPGTAASGVVTTGGIVQPTPLREIKKRLKQSSKPLMNKLEESFLHEYILPRLAQSQIHLVKTQALRFRLANGLWYKPDFVVLFDHPVRAYEVKGPHAFRGGFENLKMAATTYPELRWVLAWKENGEWKLQDVLP